MGFPLFQRPNGSVTDPMLDDAQLAYESKALSQHQRPSDSPSGDALVVHKPNGLPLYQRPNGFVNDPLQDHTELVHDPSGSSLCQRLNGSVGDPLQDYAELVHEPNGSPLLQCPNGFVGHSLQDDTKLVHGPNGSLPLQCPNGFAGHSLHDDTKLVHEPNSSLPLQCPNGFTGHSLHDDTKLVHEPNGSPPLQCPNGSVGDSLQNDTGLVHGPVGRDPHIIPTFTAESLTKPRSIVLYLPPLLSSLPQDLSLPPIAVDRPLLLTETRLPNIDPVSLSLHKALHHFGPLSEDYADLPYADAFNWSDLELPEDEEREWYGVAFRSRRKKGSDSGPLYDADRQAHEEAISNGGLLMYWYGVPNPDTGMNLATCIWQSRKHARAANSRPHHIRAMKLAAISYEIYALERYKLSKVKGEKGVLVEAFDGEECGW